MIPDEFTKRRDISRQRRWQLRQQRGRRCIICGKPAITARYCERHRRAYILQRQAMGGVVSKEVEMQIQELETKLRKLKIAQIAELQEKLSDARAVVRDLKEKLEKLSAATKRKRLPPEEVRNRIYAVLKKAKGGLRPKEISEKSGLTYDTVSMFLHNHKKDFRGTGRFNSKRYYLR
jgi:hypothetical protein